MTLAMVLCAVTLAGVLLFVGYYFGVTRPRKNTLDWVALQERAPFTFAVPRHPLERADTLPILVITALYALSAFFSLGSLKAPQAYVEFAGGAGYTIAISGEAVLPAKIWSYSTLGTGRYNVEISADGETWSTLWTRAAKDQWGRDTTEYYWANAAGYTPSYALEQGYNDILKWREVAPADPKAPLPTRFLRITGKADYGQSTLRLGKLLLLDETGAPISFDWTMADGSVPPDGLRALLAVDDTVPDAISWRNSAYFDEIYHPRTALEHIEGVEPFEWTHPPLGKLIIGLGIRLFGMTPFGWRFMGTLFGVGMLPLLYALLKHLFGKRVVATCGTVLFAAEFMHLTQTRIATIDTYGVFFILASSLFFYRWLTASATPNRRGKTGEGYGDLALSGILFGVGVACKWTVFYAGAGLAALYLIHLILRIRAWDRAELRRLWGWLAKTLLVSVGCFVVIPLVIYTASYYPYAVARGVAVDLPGTLRGFGESFPVLVHNLVGRLTAPEGTVFHPDPIPADTLSGIMLKNQWDMLTYHQGVHSFHPYASSWFQWIVDGRPILYYSQDLPNGMTERFASFNNPLLSWCGLLAVMTAIAQCFRQMWSKLTALGALGAGCALLCWQVGQVENGAFDPELEEQTLSLGAGWEFPQLTARLVLLIACALLFLTAAFFIARGTQGRCSGKDAFIAVGFLAQFLPWVLVDRITFAYHYFPSTLFLVLAVASMFNTLIDTPRAKWKVPVYGLTGGAVALYLLFYPGLTGLTIPVWYADGLLSFLPSWPL